MKTRMAWVKEIREEELASVEAVPSGVWKRYVSLEDGGRGMVFGMGRLNPGESITHDHDEEELFFVLKGSGIATWELDGAFHQAMLTPGMAFYKTSHVLHTMRAHGHEPLVGIYFKV